MNFKTFKKGVVLGVTILAIWGLSVPALFAGAIPGGTLNPRNVPKYVTPLVIPPEMPRTNSGGIEYDIEVIPITQPILPPVANDGTTLNPTPVWTYGLVGNTGTRNYPAFTIEVGVNEDVDVKWRNRLTGLPHLLPVDRSLHWANPELLPCADGSTRTDCRPDPITNGLLLQQPYTGPVPMITHVHGAHVGPASDGYPEAWYLPEGTACGGAGQPACTGRLANQFGITNTVDGAADFLYTNDQPSTTLWYHDHTLGMTRLNVYAGPAGFWLIRDGSAPNSDETGLFSGTLPSPRPVTNTSPFDHGATRGATPGNIREVPIVIQDRSFNHDPLTGATALFYPDNRAFFEGLQQAQQLQIPFVGDPLGSDIAAIWNPEFFGNVMVVNGVSWPFMNVRPERYRFRLLNGCNSRFLNLSLQALDRRGKVLIEVPFYQIGAEQGLLPNVVKIRTGFATVLPGDGTEPLPADETPQADPQSALLMGLAERADVIVDFSAVPAGTVKVRMINTAPDAPFGGFPDIPADPGTTGQVMEFVLVPYPPGTAPADPSTASASLKLTAFDEGYPTIPTTPDNTRSLALLEEESGQVCVSINPRGRVKYIPLTPTGAGFLADCTAAGGFPFAPKAAVLGNVSLDGDVGTGTPQLWGDRIMQNPSLDDTEQWELWNFTVDGHPIHLHLVHFDVVGRELFTPDPIDPWVGTRTNTIDPPQPWELGFKDTVISLPGQITHVRATFDIAGLYVWHCHIVEHEDNEMMVPYCVEADANTFCGPQDPTPAP